MLLFAILGLSAQGADQCRIDQDQLGLFLSPVRSFPIPVQVDSEFTEAERLQISAAIESWNAFGQSLIGGKFFEPAAELARIPHSFPPTCPPEATAPSLTIVRDALTSRTAAPRYPYAGMMAGLTFRCLSEGKAGRQLAILVTASIDPIQLRSVALHQLGHALGLNEACDKSNEIAPSRRACQELGPTHPYRTAVMAPSLRIQDGPEVREEITRNDRDRLSCHYGRP